MNLPIQMSKVKSFLNIHQLDDEEDEDDDDDDSLVETTHSIPEDAPSGSIARWRQRAVISSKYC
jgi:hypothetical protein